MFARAQREVGPRTRGPRRSQAGLGVMAACILAAGVALRAAIAADDAGRTRYNVMAAFLYNFASFVDWPSDPGLDEGPLTIGVLGENPFGEAASAIEKKTVNGRAIRFRVFPDVASVVPTHILFVTGARAGDLAAVRRVIAEHAVLTVGETEDFTRRGGVVRFYEAAADAGAERTLRLEINEVMARASRLEIRSKLLRLATVVDHPPPAEP